MKLKNTIILVEHDPMTIKEADLIYDFGPGSGNLGGEITAIGTPLELEVNPNSLTGKYLSGKLTIPIPKKRRTLKEFFSVKNIIKHNLTNVAVSFPKRALTCVTGVSGSGKSTLMHDIINPGLAQNLPIRLQFGSLCDQTRCRQGQLEWPLPSLRPS